MRTGPASDLFIAVIDDHKGIIFKVANSYAKSVEDRKDLVQEIILQLWRSFDTYKEEYKYSTWIYRIALNVAISNIRKEKRRSKLFSTMPGSSILELSVETNEEMEQSSRFLYQFINELKPLDKALVLLYLEDTPQREMAEILGLSETNISTKIHRIKIILKQKFDAIK